MKKITLNTDIFYNEYLDYKDTHQMYEVGELKDLYVKTDKNEFSSLWKLYEAQIENNMIQKTMDNKKLILTRDALLNDTELIRCFNMWVINFGIKNGVGGLPDFHGLLTAIELPLKKYLK